MFALTSVRNAGPVEGRRSLPRLIDGLVLPRWLRKPARSLSRVFAGDVDYPPYAASAVSVSALRHSSASAPHPRSERSRSTTRNPRLWRVSR